MSSWWCAIHGYAVPELDSAVRTQLDSMSHVMFGGLTHEPAVALGERLVARAPRGDRVLDKVFFADSGSVSVEVAMKMAWQSHAAEGLTRTKFFTIAGGYHGDTFSPMSVTDPQGGMHSMYAGFVPAHVFAPRPPADPRRSLIGGRAATSRKARSAVETSRLEARRNRPSTNNTPTRSPPSSSNPSSKAPAACTCTTPSASAT